MKTKQAWTTLAAVGLIAFALSGCQRAAEPKTEPAADDARAGAVSAPVEAPAREHPATEHPDSAVPKDHPAH